MMQALKDIEVKAKQIAVRTQEQISLEYKELAAQWGHAMLLVETYQSNAQAELNRLMGEAQELKKKISDLNKEAETLAQPKEEVK